MYINKKKYYNFIFFITRNQHEILVDFLVVLKKFFNIITRTRFEYERDVNKISIKRILKQIYWMNAQQRIWTKYFCFDFVIEFDATFNTNVLKMFFFVNVNIININIIFSITFSFVLFKAQIIIIVFLIFLNEKI